MLPVIAHIFVKNYMEQCLKIYIRNSRTDRYNIMCSIYSHEKQQPSYVDESIIGGGKSIP